LDREQTDHVDHAVAGFLDPVDEPDHEQDGDRIVQSGLALERSRQPSFERRAAEHGEDRRAIGGRQDRAQEKALGQGEVEE
jgi:hypothetical protein